MMLRVEGVEPMMVLISIQVTIVLTARNCKEDSNNVACTACILVKLHALHLYIQNIVCLM